MALERKYGRITTERGTIGEPVPYGIPPTEDPDVVVVGREAWL